MMVHKSHKVERVANTTKDIQTANIGEQVIRRPSRICDVSAVSDFFFPQISQGRHISAHLRSGWIEAEGKKGDGKFKECWKS